MKRRTRLGFMFLLCTFLVLMLGVRETWTQNVGERQEEELGLQLNNGEEENEAHQGGDSHNGHSHSHEGESVESNESLGKKEGLGDVSNEAIIKQMERKRIEDEILAHNSLGPWASAFVATTLISIAPIFVIFVVPCLSDDHNNLARKGTLKVLVSFAVGGLLGDVFLHLLPHSVPDSNHGHEHGHSHSHSQSSSQSGGATPENSVSLHESQFMVGTYVLLGMFVFFLIEKYTRSLNGGGGGGSSHSHSHGFSDNSTLISSSNLEAGKHKKEPPTIPLNSNSSLNPSIGTGNVISKDGLSSSSSSSSNSSSGSGKGGVGGSGSGSGSGSGIGIGGLGEGMKIGGLLNIIADATHNFTDGMAIAASFLISEQVGMSTTIAVLFHEIPHEIGDYAILIQNGMTVRRAMMVQAFTAVGAYLGTFFGLITGGDGHSSFRWILPFTGGGFIYLATVTVIPELLETSSLRQSLKEISAIVAGGLMMAFLSSFE